jgi:DNA-binding Lrp family transcriptional regulator
MSVQEISWRRSRFALIDLRGWKTVDEADRKILNAIQSEFPIRERPYEELGRQVGLSEEDVLKRVKRLRELGIIRRIGGNFHSSKLDFTSTLCAAKVPEEKLERFVEVVNRYPGVTHNYLRNHEFNVWFTFIAPSSELIEHSLREISELTEVKEVYSLPAVKMFKIKVDFEV